MQIALNSHLICMFYYLNSNSFYLLIPELCNKILGWVPSPCGMR